MARLGNDQIVVKPTNNVFTALTFVGFLATLLALIAVLMSAKTMFGDYLFF